jgi:uncharacterized membrane protein
VTTPDDDYWDDLGVAWRAINPDASAIAPRIEARVRRQSALIVATIVIGLPLSAFSLGLGVFTIWTGWTSGSWNFVTRGAAIAAIAILMAIAILSLLAVRHGRAAAAVSDMLDLSIARAQRTLFGLRLGMAVCGIAAVMGVAGTVIRSRLTRPPQMSPIVDLLLLALCALGLFAWGRNVRLHLGRLRAVKRALRTEGQQ